jgi:hypothetical protein
MAERLRRARAARFRAATAFIFRRALGATKYCLRRASRLAMRLSSRKRRSASSMSPGPFSTIRVSACLCLSSKARAQCFPARVVLGGVGLGQRPVVRLQPLQVPSLACRLRPERKPIIEISRSHSLRVCASRPHRPGECLHCPARWRRKPWLRCLGAFRQIERGASQKNPLPLSERLAWSTF